MSIGWIFEDAVERLGENFSGDTGHLHEELLPLQCPLCGASVDGTEALTRHVATSHPLDVPTLLYKGRVVPCGYTLRMPSVPSDLQLVGADCIEVSEDGRPLSALTRPEFERSWCAARNSVWDVALIRRRDLDSTQVCARYRVQFRIPELAELDLIDRRFVRILAVDAPSRSDVSQFAGIRRTDSPAQEYEGALGEYALALILKQEPQSAASPVEAFQESAQRMKSALAVLGWFPRPVAAAVSAVIRFNLNWYRTALPPTAMPLLRAATELFRGVADGCIPDLTEARVRPAGPASAERPICPVDPVTRDILSLCQAVLARQPISVPYVEAMEKRCRGPSVTEADLLKLRVLLAISWTTIGQAERSRQHLERLRYDTLTERWANATLDSMKASS